MAAPKTGDRVLDRSYGVGTLVGLEHYHRGESVARVRFDCFLGTKNDRALTTPLADLARCTCLRGGSPDAWHARECAFYRKDHIP